MSASPTDSGLTRFPDVEAEILEMRLLPCSEWLRRMKKLHSETVVFLIRLIDRDTGDVSGGLLMELGKRAIRIANRVAQGFDETTIELIVRQVYLKVIERVTSETKQPDFLEVSFATAVRSLTVDEIRKHKNSPTGGLRANYVPSMNDVEGLDEDEEFEALEFVRDTRPNPEAALLDTGQEVSPDEVVEKLYRVVKDPLEAEAVMLIHFHGCSYEEAAEALGITPRQIEYRLVKGLRAIRGELGVRI